MSKTTEDSRLAAVPVGIVARWRGEAAVLNVNEKPGVRARLLRDGSTAYEYEKACQFLFKYELELALRRRDKT